MMEKQQEKEELQKWFAEYCDKMLGPLIKELIENDFYYGEAFSFNRPPRDPNI